MDGEKAFCRLLAQRFSKNVFDGRPRWETMGVERKRGILDDLALHLLSLQGEVEIVLSTQEEVKHCRECVLFSEHG